MRFYLLKIIALSLFLVSIQAQACLQNPIPGSIITSNFGYRLQPVLKIWRQHKGMDMRASEGTPVKSAHSGLVTFAGYTSSGGNIVSILDGSGVQTRYLHLKVPAAIMGEMVSSGTVIGLSGRTGLDTTQPHLHFETSLNNGRQPVDPRSQLCESLPEKSGAGPDSAGGGSRPMPGSSGSPSPLDIKSPDFNSYPDYNSYASMSEAELIKAEVSRRFMNQNWQSVLGSCGVNAEVEQIRGQQSTPTDCRTFYLRELHAMKLLKNFLKYKTKEAVEMMNAVQASTSEEMLAQSRKNIEMIRERALQQSR